jgi:hypothetical protein
MIDLFLTAHIAKFGFWPGLEQHDLYSRFLHLFRSVDQHRGTVKGLLASHTSAEMRMRF